ncbi:flocculation protein FLO11 isoform X2 [Nilaparvata lugens]|nr:flocculation protein FLO11 isoform X2 [Nilaparvata lugens]
MRWEGVWRVNGVISVSRAIGDVKLKPSMTAEPEIRVLDLDGTEDYLILSSDGVWDVIKKEDAVECCDIYLYENPGDVKGVSASLAKLASSLGASDNLSVVVTQLSDNQRLAHRLAQNPLLYLNSATRHRHRDHFDADNQQSSDFNDFEADFGPESNVDDSDDEEEGQVEERRNGVIGGGGGGGGKEAGGGVMDDPHGPLAPPVPPLHGGPFQASPVSHNYLGGIDEPDNVAESEGEGNVDDSDEEEWNYIKGQDEENSKEDENDKNQTNKPNKDVDDDTSVDAEEDIDMESQLNPEAAEFVPVSPTRVAKESRDHLLDDVISSSPMKGCEKSLDNIIIPTEEDFRRDVAHCASSLEDELNGDLNTTAKDQLNDSQFTALSQCGDESEVMSTKAEFGDSVFGLGVSMNNSTAFVAEIHNDKEPVSNDFDPIYDADKDVHNFDTIQAPDHDDPLIPGTPKSTVAEASHSPNFDGNFSGEDQPFEMEKPEEQQQQQPLSVSPIPEESRPPTFAEILKRPSPRSSATNSPRTSPEPPESPPVEKKNFNPFSNENDVAAAPESIIINNMNECEKKFETIEEESKQTFEDILLPGKTDTQDFSHANTNPFSADNVDFANFEHNTHPVNNQLDLDMMCTKPTHEFMLNNELNTPDDEKPPMTFQVETEPPKTETNFDDFISHNNSDPMTQSFIVSPVLENPSHVEMSLMPEAPLDNDASSFIVEKISENFEDEKPSMGFGFTDDKLEENEFNSIVENRFEDKPLVDTISNNEQQLLEENDYAAPLSPVREEVQEQQPPASSMQIDETHFDLKLDAPIEAAPQDQSPLVPEALSPAEPEHNFNVLDADEPLETKMDHFSHPIPEAVPSEDVKAMDDFLATESRDNLIEAVSDELKDEVCLMKADVSANVENVSEVAELLDTAPVVDSQVPEEKAPESALIAPESALTAPESALIAPEPALTAPESALTQAAAQQKEEALEPTFNVDFVAAEPILTPVESAKVEEQPAEQLVVAAEVHPPTTETPPPTPAVPAVVEDKKEGLIAAAAAVAGAAVAIAAAATTKAAPTKKPTTLSSAGAKKPGVASTAAKKPTDLASKAAGAKAAPSKAAAPGAKATSPTKPVAIKKTAVTSTTSAAKPSKPLAGLKSAAATAKPLSPASKPTTPTSKPSTPTSSSRPSSAPKTSPTKTTAVKATVGAAAAAKPKSAVADKKPLTNGTSRPASSTLAAKKPATTATAATKTVGAAKPATTAAKPAAKVGAAAPKPKAPVSSTTSRPAAPAAAPAKPPPIRAPAKPSDKTGKETINKQISSAKPAAAKTAAPAKPAPIKKTDAKPTANGKVPAGKPVPKSATAVKKPPTTATAADDKKKKADGAAPTQEHTVTTTNGYEEPPLPLNGLAKDDSPLENHIHQDALVIN